MPGSIRHRSLSRFALTAEHTRTTAVTASDVLILATGGTIASTRKADGTVGVTLTGADLLAGLDPTTAAGLEVIELAGVPSWNFEPAFVASIATTARDALRSGRAAGVVITHGTDTIEETAFLADVLAGAATDHGPIIVTGAMRNARDRKSVV